MNMEVICRGLCEELADKVSERSGIEDKAKVLGYVLSYMKRELEDPKKMDDVISYICGCEHWDEKYKDYCKARELMR